MSYTRPLVRPHCAVNYYLDSTPQGEAETFEVGSREVNTTRASLLLRLRNPADQPAWREFDSIYRPMLGRMVRKAGLHDADAEDVVQHCMASIHQHIQGFEYDPSKGKFKSWLRTLVNNRIRNLRRARAHVAAETGDFERPQEREPLPEQVFEDLWLQEHLRFALSQIREEVEPTTFEAYQRYVVNGERVNEVCERLGMNANQLYAIKFRVTRILQQKVAELVDGTSAD